MLDVGCSIVPVSSFMEWFHTFCCIVTAASSMVSVLWEVSGDAPLKLSCPAIALCLPII